MYVEVCKLQVSVDGQRQEKMSMSYFGWNDPSARRSRISFNDRPDSGVHRYNRRSLLFRDGVQSIAGRPLLRT